jgi:hypothetical protein
VAGALVLGLGLTACGSDSGSSGSSEAEEETAETYAIVPDAEVTAGLAELQQMGVAVTAAITAGSDASADVDEMFEKWESIEGTIKQNEVEMYLTFEDSLANIRKAAQDKDAAASTEAVQTFDETVAAYLAKHP